LPKFVLPHFISVLLLSLTPGTEFGGGRGYMYPQLSDKGRHNTFCPPQYFCYIIVFVQTSLPRYCQGICVVQWWKVPCVWRNLNTLPIYMKKRY